MSDYNKTLIDDLRAHGGHATDEQLGRSPVAHPDDHRREDRRAPRDPPRLHHRRRPARRHRLEGRRSDPSRPGTTTSSRTPR